MGVGAVVTGHRRRPLAQRRDRPRRRRHACWPVSGSATPTHSYGPVIDAPGGRAATSGRRCLAARGAHATTSRRVAESSTSIPPAPATIVDGSAQTLADMAAFGALPGASPILYAGDLNAAHSPPRGRCGREPGRRRLQPPPRVPARVHPAEPRRHARPEPAASPPARRVINPFPRAGSQRPDGVGAAGRALPPARRACRASCSSPRTRRSRPSTATCRPRGWPIGSWPRLTAGSRSASTRRATCPT